MTARALFEHYVEYITSPQILLTIAVVVAPVLFMVFANGILSQSDKPLGVPGCRRVGLLKRSNLADQYRPSPPISDEPRVKALFTYPIKSCRGVELPASEVEAKGLRHDRHFTFAQLVPKKNASGESGAKDDETHEWRFMTLREHPRLALIETQLWLPNPLPGQLPSRGRKTNDKLVTASSPQPRVRSRTRGSTLVGELERASKSANPAGTFADNGGCMVAQFTHSPDINPFGIRNETVTLQLPLSPTPQRAEAKRYTSENMVIWKDCPLATNVTNEIKPDALKKLQQFLGITNPLALFKVDDQNLRSMLRCLPKDRPDEEFRVGFADAFSVNLLNVASVRAVDETIPSTSEMKGKLDARRFRANIYISGVPGYTEETWKKITVGRRIGRDERGLFETDGEYHVACRTARCTLPNVDPDTGLKDRNEPYTTLGKTRKVDKGAYPHPCLGMQMIPLFERGMIKVGDKISILESGEHCYEKMFP